MRVLVLALTLSGCVWCVVVRLTARDVGPLTRLAGTAGLFTILSAAITGAVSIAGDRRLVRLAVRRGAPLPRGPIFAAKWLACMIVWLGTTAAVSVVGLLCASLLGGVWAVLDMPLFWAFLAFGCCFAASAALGHGLAALLAGAGIAVLPAMVLYEVFGVSPGASWGLGLKVATTVPVHLFLLSLAWRMLRVGRGPTPVRHPRLLLASRAAALCAAALGMAFLVPIAAYVQTVSLSRRDVTRIERLEVSPDGRFLALTVHARQLPFDVAIRCCVVEPETGATTWLTRVRDSGSWSDGGWSPGGRYFACPIWEGFLEEAWLRLAEQETCHRQRLGFFDARTQESWAISHPEWRYVGQYWWADEGALACRVAGLQLHYRPADRRVEALGPGKAYVPPRIGPGWRASRHGAWLLEAPNGWWLRFHYRQPRRARDGVLGIGNSRTGEADGVGYLNRPLEHIGPMCSFSSSGRWFAYVARPDRRSRPVSWLHDTTTGQRRALNPARVVTQWAPRFTPDETKLVWAHATVEGRSRVVRTDQLRFQVQALTDEAPHPLPLPREAAGKADPLQFGVSNTCVYFVRRQRVYGLRLDGSGCRQVFP